ncbi:MAG: hypothetical protein CMN33_01210 [Saprospirales bacterium]|nr:hypothetical protein [Saprospirales bacterium]|tara:strand:- start:524 stop:754 length:231 start_codon:yes stop_codon:yes gene_type:complete
MKAYILISFLLTEPVVYDDRDTCWEARDTINQSLSSAEPAVCIPQGRVTKDYTIEDFFDLVIRLENLPPLTASTEE